jgi:hypothetical protein
MPAQAGIHAFLTKSPRSQIVIPAKAGIFFIMPLRLRKIPFSGLLQSIRLVALMVAGIPKQR